MARQQNQIKPVLDLVDAIFDGNTGHRLMLLKGLRTSSPRKGCFGAGEVH
jgi:hypothetical protein